MNLSALPPVVSLFKFPVQYGWHFEQTSTFISGFVETYDERDKLDYLCPTKGIIAELIVSKFSRSKGTGGLLLTTMEDYFKSIGCEYIQLDVFAYNETAKIFYYKNNYEDRMVTLFKKIK